MNVQIPDSFAFGVFIGTVFGLMLYPFVIGTVYKKPEIRVVIPKRVVIYDKTMLEKTDDISIKEE